MHVLRNNVVYSRNHFCSGKAIHVCIKYYACGFVFLPLTIRNEMRMGRIILLLVACLALQYFST
jgi:hypothetical protein